MRVYHVELDSEIISIVIKIINIHKVPVEINTWYSPKQNTTDWLEQITEFDFSQFEGLRSPRSRCWLICWLALLKPSVLSD